MRKSSTTVEAGGEENDPAPSSRPYPFGSSPSPDAPADRPRLTCRRYEGADAKGAPWWIQQNLVFVPRPVWIVEGQSSDPYYNSQGIMYFDKEMSASNWKQVHNRAGEYFYTAMCGYHFVKNDENLLGRLPKPGGGRERQDEPRRARRPLPDSFLEQSWTRLLLAAHPHPHDRLMRGWRSCCSSGRAARAADAAGAQVLEHKGRWESATGPSSTTWSAGSRNTSGHELRYVKLRIEALDEHGNRGRQTDTYNESAEALAVPDLNPRELLESGKVKPLPADAESASGGAS